MNQPQAIANPSPSAVLSLRHRHANQWRSPDQALFRRLLGLLRDPCPSTGDGRWTWSALRQTLGGRVRPELLREVLDRMINAGWLVEAWEASRGAREPRHFVCRPELWRQHRWGLLIEVRVRRDILEELELTHSTELTPQASG